MKKMLSRAIFQKQEAGIKDITSKINAIEGVTENAVLKKRLVPCQR